MYTLIPYGTKVDFMGKAPFFLRLTAASLVVALIAIFMPGIGIKFGLDFSGGYEVLMAFDKPVTAEQVRAEVGRLELGDTSVQSFDVPDSKQTHYLVRVQRSEVLSPEELKQINDAFSTRYAANFKGPVGYNPEMGHVIEVQFASSATVGAAATSSVTIVEVVESTGHTVNRIRRLGRAEEPRYSVVMRGIDVTMVNALQKSLDPTTQAVRTEFVGPTVGKQLRDEGVLAVFYTLVIMLIYIAIRFDFFYAPGAVLNVFHDAVITCGFLALLQRDFNLATIAGILTLVGYSINDTIIVYDRIRETVGKARGKALDEVLNRAINETLARTIMTSSTTFLACLCMMFFGRGTVLFDFGLIMAFGVIIGTYSSIYVAAPIFKFMRERFAGDEADEPAAQQKSAARV